MIQKKTLKAAGGMERGEVHLHLLLTDKFPPKSAEDLLFRLPTEDRRRYRELALESRQREFLWSRLFVRKLLAFYTGKAMESLKFGFGNQSKPFLEDSVLEFNLSHTEGLMACSVAGSPVGVDVERVKKGPRARNLARFLGGRFFSGVESAFLQSLPLESQGPSFIRIFTMKEAYIKALGFGLHFPLSSFTVPLTAGERSRAGNWEWFTRVWGNGEYCLSQAVEIQPLIPRRYRIYDWDEISLLEALKKNGPAFPFRLSAVA